MYDDLTNIDSLLFKSMPDSAYKELNVFNPHIMDKKCKAYYDLLMTQARYVLYMDADSNINIDDAIKYYVSHNDKSKLARALHYKAGNLRDMGNIMKALEMEKRAEMYIDGETDIFYAMKIYNMLSAINLNTKNLEQAKQYSYKALNLAEKMKHKEDIAHMHYALASIYNSIATEYDEDRYIDSAIYHIEKALLFIDHTKTSKHSILFQAAMEYRNKNDWEKAEYYANEVMGIHKDVDIDMLLGDIYVHTGRMDEGLAIFQKILPELEGVAKWQTMQLMEDVMMKQGRYVEAAKMQEAITLFKDSMAIENKRQAEEALRVQTEFDWRMQKEAERSDRQKLVICIYVLLIALVFGMAYYVQRARKFRHTMMYEKKKTEEYEARLAELEHAGEKSEREMELLRKKIVRHKEKMAEMINRGKALYDKVAAKEKSAAWSRYDYVDFIEYYRTLNPGFVANVETEYRGLTPYNIFFMILADMNMSDEDICHIGGITQGALRTMKSRINKRKEA